MTRKLTIDDFPENATYTKLNGSIYRYDGDRCVFAVTRYVFYDQPTNTRYHDEINITRDEAIRIVKERGQFDDGEAHNPFISGTLPGNATRVVNDQPDPIADLTRRLAAAETRMAELELERRTLGQHAAYTTSVASKTTVALTAEPPAPAQPPLPVVPECGYWEYDGKRYVLAEPVEWRIAESGEAFLYAAMDVVGVAKCRHAEPRYILRELIQPAAPAGYEVVGWGRPKEGEPFLGASGDVITVNVDFDATCDGGGYRWLLRPVPKKLKVGDTVTDGDDEGQIIAIHKDEAWVHYEVYGCCTADLDTLRLAEIREEAK